ncbi:MAG: S8 family serine peptidase [Marinomonas sp.]
MVLNAVGRAATAGVVVVVAAGNGGDGSEPGIDPDQPDPFATSILQAGNGNVIIVGSVDENGNVSDFSNRAGDQASSVILARGEAVCCVYDDGELFITEENGQRFVTLFSGTSFSAPQVAGAVALLAQAFPNLTAAEIVEILLDSARDIGAAGDDAIAGVGIMDLAAAFAPSGATTVAGTGNVLRIADDALIGSSAMGDAPGAQTLSTIVLDRYKRAYNYNLSGQLRSANVAPKLRGAVEQSGRSLAAGSDAVSMAFRVDNGPRAAGLNWSSELQLSSDDARLSQVLAGRVAAKIAPDLELGIAYREGASGLVAQLQGHSRPAFRLAGTASGDDGFFQGSIMSLALRRKMGDWGLSVSAESGDAWLGNYRRADGFIQREREKRPTQSVGFALDRKFGSSEAVLGLTWLNESDTVLGAHLHEAIGGNGANTAFIDASFVQRIQGNWQIGADLRQGMTMARSSGLVGSGSRIMSQAFSLDVSRTGTLTAGDMLGVRVSQPLRVMSGGLNLELPTAYDYASDSPIFSNQRVNLTPQGREMMGEITWRGPLMFGAASGVHVSGRGGASLFYRHNPGHFADQPADVGAMVSFSADF